MPGICGGLQVLMLGNNGPRNTFVTPTHQVNSHVDACPYKEMLVWLSVYTKWLTGSLSLSLSFCEQRLHLSLALLNLGGVWSFSGAKSSHHPRSTWSMVRSGSTDPGMVKSAWVGLQNASRMIRYIDLIKDHLLFSNRSVRDVVMDGGPADHSCNPFSVACSPHPGAAKLLLKSKPSVPANWGDGSRDPNRGPRGTNRRRVRLWARRMDEEATLKVKSMGCEMACHKEKSEDQMRYII